MRGWKYMMQLVNFHEIQMVLFLGTKINKIDWKMHVSVRINDEFAIVLSTYEDSQVVQKQISPRRC